MNWLRSLHQMARQKSLNKHTDYVRRGLLVQSWIERLQELTSGYELRNIWNMDELGLFFKALAEKGLLEKSRRCKGGKKSKQLLTADFFVAADGSKISEPVVIWKSESPKCFNKIQDKIRPSNGTLLLK